jgi:hypothetical protein
MIIAVWIVSGLLALANLLAGGLKLVRPREALIAIQPWAGDFSARQIKGIGALEVLGAIGLILPPLLGVLPVLAGFAAVGIAALQVGALVTHVRRKEPIVPNIVILALALFVAVTRFMGY